MTVVFSTSTSILFRSFLVAETVLGSCFPFRTKPLYNLVSIAFGV